LDQLNISQISVLSIWYPAGYRYRYRIQKKAGLSGLISGASLITIIWGMRKLETGQMKAAFSKTLRQKSFSFYSMLRRTKKSYPDPSTLIRINVKGSRRECSQFLINPVVLKCNKLIFFSEYAEYGQQQREGRLWSRSARWFQVLNLSLRPFLFSWQFLRLSGVSSQAIRFSYPH
jgi:hypothetical protein